MLAISSNPCIPHVHLLVFWAVSFSHVASGCKHFETQRAVSGEGSDGSHDYQGTRQRYYDSIVQGRLIVGEAVANMVMSITSG